MTAASRTALPTPRVIHTTPAIIVAELGAVCVTIWRGLVTKDPFELQRKGLAEVVQRHPEGAGFLCVVENAAKPPEDALRRASSEMILSHGSKLKCVACVMEGQGFMTAVNRGALAGMVLLLRNRETEVSVFSKVAEAGRWMGQHVSLPAVDQFPALIERIRAQLPAPPGP